jgi:hypothetical protein
MTDYSRQCNRRSVNSFAEYDIDIYSVCNEWTQRVKDAHKITKYAFEKCVAWKCSFRLVFISCLHLLCSVFFYRTKLWTLCNYVKPTIFLTIVHSRRRDSVNKASPSAPQLTARSGQSAQLVQCTHCIRTHVNLHSDWTVCLKVICLVFLFL